MTFKKASDNAIISTQLTQTLSMEKLNDLTKYYDSFITVGQLLEILKDEDPELPIMLCWRADQYTDFDCRVMTPAMTVGNYIKNNGTLRGDGDVIPVVTYDQTEDDISHVVHVEQLKNAGDAPTKAFVITDETSRWW